MPYVSVFDFIYAMTDVNRSVHSDRINDKIHEIRYMFDLFDFDGGVCVCVCFCAD